MIGDRVAVTGSGHYSVTSYLEVPGEHLVHTGMRPTACCWKMLETARSQDRRKPFPLVGLPGLEPGTSSLSAKYREPLCGRPFSQVALDRGGRSYVLSSRPVTSKCSHRAPRFVAAQRLGYRIYVSVMLVQ
jgi:hypothetical protein